MAVTTGQSSSRKRGVVLLPGATPTPRHEHLVHELLGRKIGDLLGCPFLGTHDAATQPAGDYYFIPADTLVDVHLHRLLGIRDEGDFFGGLVAQPFMATKAISHPLFDRSAHKPEGWTDDFAERATSATLHGFSVFDVDSGKRAGRQLLHGGPVRLKPVHGKAGRGQVVVRDAQQLDAALGVLDANELEHHGLVLEEDLSDVTTYSVGQTNVANVLLSYYGTQRLTRDNQGESVYGGSDLVLVRGDYDQLLALDLDAQQRRAIEQARLYEQVASAALPGFVASRRNYDIAEGLDPQGQRRSGVLEQSWRIGGASAAEILALEAFIADPQLHRLRASTIELYGPVSPPSDAIQLFQGSDSQVGLLSKYARTQPYASP